MTRRSSFPLQWPEGWKRTAYRERSMFEPHFTQDRDQVIRWLEKRGSRVVITSNLPTRQDGLPYNAGGVSDPGIAVWWVEKGHERVIACDRWARADENLRAIMKTLEAMRGLDQLPNLFERGWRFVIVRGLKWLQCGTCSRGAK